MEEKLDRILGKLDLILKLIRDCNSTLKRLESRGESQHINNISIDDAREPEVVYETELDPKNVAEQEQDSEIVDETELDVEVIDEPNPESEVKDSLMETPVDLLAEPIIEVLPSSPTMKALLPLRLPNVYDPL